MWAGPRVGESFQKILMHLPLVLFILFVILGSLMCLMTYEHNRISFVNNHSSSQTFTVCSKCAHELLTKNLFIHVTYKHTNKGDKHRVKCGISTNLRMHADVNECLCLCTGKSSFKYF